MIRKRIDAFNIIANFIMVLLCIFFLFPFYYMLIYSLSDSQAVSQHISLLPVSFTLQNYADILKSPEIVGAFVISVLRSVTGTVLTIICSTLIAYLVTKQELPFRKIIYRLIVTTMYISAGIIPWYMTMKSYGLKNNFLLYILPSAVTAYYVILIKTYIESIPPSLEESAALDGAGIITTLTKIIFPVCLPIIAAISVFSAVYQWNGWWDNMMLVSKPALKTLQYALYEYFQQASPNITNIQLAGDKLGRVRPNAQTIKVTMAMVTIIPIFMVYPFLQKYFVKGIMLGAIKG